MTSRIRRVVGEATFLTILTVVPAAMHVTASAQGPSSVGRLRRELRIGSVNEDSLALSRVGSLVVGREGSIYVSQPQEATIKVFDSQGGYRADIGRDGGGPGEFRNLTGMGWLGDTLWVADSRLRRVSFFSPDGTYWGSMPLDYVPAGRSGVPIAVDGLLQGAAVVGQPVVETQLALGRQLAEMPIVLMNGSGTTITLAVRDLRRFRYLVQTERGVTVSTYQPLDDSPLVQTAPNGASVVVVERSAATHPDDSQFRVTKLLPTMDTVFSRQVDYVPVRVPASVLDSVLNRAVESIRRLYGNLRDARSGARAALYLPKFYPPVTSIAVSSEGTVWLRREAMAADSVHWDVLDGRSGRLLTTVTAPAGLEIFEVQRDRLWGVETDQFDVPYVVGYAILVSERGR